MSTPQGPRQPPILTEEEKRAVMSARVFSGEDLLHLMRLAGIFEQSVFYLVERAAASHNPGFAHQFTFDADLRVSDVEEALAALMGPQHTKGAKRPGAVRAV